MVSATSFATGAQGIGALGQLRWLAILTRSKPLLKISDPFPKPLADGGNTSSPENEDENECDEKKLSRTKCAHYLTHETLYVPRVRVEHGA